MRFSLDLLTARIPHLTAFLGNKSTLPDVSKLHKCHGKLLKNKDCELRSSIICRIHKKVKYPKSTRGFLYSNADIKKTSTTGFLRNQREQGSGRSFKASQTGRQWNIRSLHFPSVGLHCDRGERVQLQSGSWYGYLIGNTFHKTNLYTPSLKCVWAMLAIYSNSAVSHFSLLKI